MIRKCIGCNKKLNIKNFDKYKKEDKYYFKSRCKPCHRKNNLKYLKLFKQKNPDSKSRKENPSDARELAKMTRERLF